MPTACPPAPTPPALPLPPTGAAVWQLLLQRSGDAPSSWQAVAVGPGGSHVFGSIAELSSWLAQFDTPAVPAAGIR